MSRALRICILAAWLPSAATLLAADKAVTYYVQLIRCCEQEQPPEPGSRRVGPKLAERFQCVFKARSYWEICQEEIDVLPGRAARVRLRNDREVEIDLRQAGKRQVTAYRKGRLIDRTVEPAGEHMTLIGGDRDGTSQWFIAVRRDKPSP